MAADKLKFLGTFDPDFIKGMEQIMQMFMDLNKQAENLNSKKINLTGGGKELAENVKLANELKKALEEVERLKKLAAKPPKVPKKELTEAEKLQQRIAKANEKTTEEYAKQAAELKELQAKIRENIKLAKSEEGSYNRLRAQMVKLKKEYKETGDAAKRAKLGEDIKLMSDEIKRLGSNIGEFQDDVGNYKKALDGLSGAFQNIAGLAGGFGLALGGAELLQQGIELLNEARKEISEIEKQLNTIGSLSKEQIGEATNQMRALKDRGVETKEAMDLINKGVFEFGSDANTTLSDFEQILNRGGNNAEKYIGIINNTSSAFKDAKINIKEAGALLIQFDKAGQNIDNAAETVREFTIRMREFTPATEKALKDAGVDFKTLREEITTGKKSYIDALKELAALTDGMAEGTVKGQLLADVFGTTSEDATSLLKVFKNLDTDLSKLPETISPIEKAQIRLNKAFIQTTSEAGELNAVLAKIITFGAELLENIKPLQDAVQDVFEPFVDIFMDIFDTVSNVANAFGLLEGETSAAEIIIKTLTTTLQIATAPMQGLLFIVKELVGFFKFLSENIGTAKDKITEMVDGVLNFIKELPIVGTLIQKTLIEPLGFLFEQVEKALKKVGLLKEEITGLKAVEVKTTPTAKKPTAQTDAEIKAEEAKQKELERQRKEPADKAKKDGEKTDKEETDRQKKLAADLLRLKQAQIANMQNERERELAAAKLASEIEINDLMKRMEAETTSEETRNVLDKTIEQLQEQHRQNLFAINQKYDQQEKANEQANTQKTIAELQKRFATQEEIEKSNFEVELSKLKLTNEKKLEKQNEFDQQIIQNRINTLKLIEEATGQSFEKELLLLENKLTVLQNKTFDGKDPKKGFLATALGVNDEQLDFLKTQFGAAFEAFQDFITAVNEERIKDLEAQIAVTEERISDKEAELETERQLNEEGQANDLIIKQQELEALQEQKRQETAELEKANKEKERLAAIALISDKAMQISNLITSATEIFAAHSGIPFAGVAIAAGFVAAMLSTMAAFKQSARAFNEGTELIGYRGNKKGIDTVPAMVKDEGIWLDGRERIVDGDTNATLLDMGIKNADLIPAAKALRAMQSGYGQTPIGFSMANMTISGLNEQNKLLQNGNNYLQKMYFASQNRQEAFEIGGKMIILEYKNGKIVSKSIKSI